MFNVVCSSQVLTEAIRGELRALMKPMHEHLPHGLSQRTQQQLENRWLCYLDECMSMRTLITIVDLEHSRMDGGPGLNSLDSGDELYNAIQHAIDKRRRFERPTEDGASILKHVRYTVECVKSYEYKLTRILKQSIMIEFKATS